MFLNDTFIYDDRGNTSKYRRIWRLLGESPRERTIDSHVHST